MTDNINDALAQMRRLSVGQLRVRYAEVFGEPTRTSNKAWLIKRLAWRLQALAEGDLSDRARQRAAELARDADLRLSAPRPPRDGQSVSTATLPNESQASDSATPFRSLDPRLPPPGSLLMRSYKGQTIEVKV